MRVAVARVTLYPYIEYNALNNFSKKFLVSDQMIVNFMKSFYFELEKRINSKSTGAVA